ncbi:MAG TPA: ATP-binding protein [bacterium]|nr:ATP-binding protein [bacterium]
MTRKTTSYRLKLPSRTDNLETVRKFVADLARKAGFGKEDIHKIELAVDEACTNVIEHAYENAEDQDIDIVVKLGPQKLTVIVTDRGKTFSPGDIETPDMEQYIAELRVGGLGIYLMRTLMDKVQYRSLPDGKNQVKMEKYLEKRS